MRRLFPLFVAALLVLGPASPATADDTITATGSFVTDLFLPTFTTTPVGATACRVTVEGQLTFEGTLSGTGAAATTALIFASCEDVQSHPPGAFPDVFSSQIEFDGTVADIPVTADILWLGSTEAGGDIDAVMLVDGEDIEGRLSVDAAVGVGGAYQGILKLG